MTLTSLKDMKLISIYVLVLVILGVGVANINTLHETYEKEIEECIAEGGGYECF